MTLSTMTAKTLSLIAGGMLALGVFSAPALAQDAAAKGLEIAREADRRDIGFGDTKANMTMTLFNAHGGKAERKLRVRTLEQSKDGDKSLLIFDNPGDVKGTAFLSFSHKKGADDQWLYLPSLKRVKRISQSNQSGPFVGSEFAFEDMSSQEVEKYTYNYVGDQSFDGRDHFVVEADPVNKKSGYSKQVVYFDKKEYRVWKIDFYDRRGAYLKTLTASGYKKYKGRYWRPETQLMINHQTGKKTELVITDYVFRTGFSNRDFSKEALQKAR